jgi:hypothetical protein
MVSTSCAKRVPTDSWCTCSQSKTWILPMLPRAWQFVRLCEHFRN